MVVTYFMSTKRENMAWYVHHPTKAKMHSWGNSAPAGAAGRAVGTGYQNTTDIVLGCPEEGIAARLCYDLEMNGYSDWFLPSIDELLLMYTNLHSKGSGSFDDHFYWSSTQDKYGCMGGEFLLWQQEQSRQG